MASPSTNDSVPESSRVSWPLAFLGAVSGSLSWGVLEILDALRIDFSLLQQRDSVDVGPTSTIPGLVFGLLFGAALIRHRGIGIGRFLGYVLASGIGYLAAYHAALYSVLGLNSVFQFLGLVQVSSAPEEPISWVIGGILGGLVGSFLLGLASKYLLSARWADVLGAPLVAGTLAGAALSLMYFDVDSHGMPISLLVFFAFWQAVYAASLAPLLRSAALR